MAARIAAPAMKLPTFSLEAALVASTGADVVELAAYFIEISISAHRISNIVQVNLQSWQHLTWMKPWMRPWRWQKRQQSWRRWKQTKQRMWRRKRQRMIHLKIHQRRRGRRSGR